MPNDLLRAYLEKHESSCPRCGYSLRRCITETCPECGTALALTLAPRRADRRTLVLLALMLGWVLVASAFECFDAQQRVWAEARGSQFGTIMIVATEAGVQRAGSPARPITFQSVRTLQPASSGTSLAPNWSAVTWRSWLPLGSSGLLALLALTGLGALLLNRARPQWPPVLVRYSEYLFLVWGVFALAFRFV